MARKISERLSPADVSHYEATRYGGNQKLVDRIEQRIVRELLHQAVAPGESAARKQLQALDIPCGYGRFTDALLELEPRLVDFDRSDSMAARAAERAVQVGAPRPGAGVADIRALPFADRSFDIVLSMRLLHHLYNQEDRDSMFAELARITRGHLVISYYDRTLIHRIQRKLGGLVKKKRRNTKIFFFGTDPFTAEAARAGFEVIAVRAPLRLFHAQRIALLRRKS